MDCAYYEVPPDKRHGAWWIFFFFDSVAPNLWDLELSLSFLSCLLCCMLFVVIPISANLQTSQHIKSKC